MNCKRSRGELNENRRNSLTLSIKLLRLSGVVSFSLRSADHRSLRVDRSSIC